MLALRELYLKLSNELHQDNLIHKDEFMWALFKANRDNLFAERVRSRGAARLAAEAFYRQSGCDVCRRLLSLTRRPLLSLPSATQVFTLFDIKHNQVR